MKIRYFEDTDTLYIEFKAGTATDARDLDEDTRIELDNAGRVLSVTIERAHTRAEIPRFSYERIAA